LALGFRLEGIYKMFVENSHFKNLKIKVKNEKLQLKIKSNL